MVKKLQWYWWVVGVIVTVGSAGWMTASYASTLATKSDLSVVKTKVEGIDRDIREQINSLDKDVRKLEIINDRVDQRQQKIERKIDWLIQHELNPRAPIPPPQG